MSRTVLITGAGGFLARHTAESFRAAGWRVLGVGRTDPDRISGLYAVFQLDDLSDAARIASLIEKHRPEAVVHLAAPSSVPESLRRPLSDLEAHVLPTARLLEAMRIAAVPARLLLVSSAAVYGQPETLPIREDAPLRPLSPYGFHKLQQELICDEYLTVFGTQVLKARVFSTFGEGLRRLAVFDLTARMLLGDTTVFGTGDEIRDYLYAADIGSAFRTIVENATFDGSAINVASGERTTIAELAEHIHQRLGVREPLTFTGTAPAGLPQAWIADVGRLRALGWQPAHTREAALDRTMEWIQRNA